MGRRKTISFKKILLLIVLIAVCLLLLRMVLIVNDRTSLAIERRDSAKADLNEIVTLGKKIEAEARELSTASGQRKVLRERYGLVSENEGYLILLHDHEDTNETTNQQWWQVW